MCSRREFRVTSDSVLSARWQSLWWSVQKPSSRDQVPNEHDASLLVYISRGWLLRVVETERLHLVLRRARD